MLDRIGFRMPAVDRRSWPVVALVVLGAVFVLWFMVVPVSVSQSVHRIAVGGHHAGCVDVTDQHGIGPSVLAHTTLHPLLCWDGTRVHWEFGLHRWDCATDGGLFTAVHLTCVLDFPSRGEASVTYAMDASPLGIPLLHRQTVLRIVLAPDGRVIEFS